MYENFKDRKPCRVIKKCPTETKKQCPACDPEFLNNLIPRF